MLGGAIVDRIKVYASATAYDYLGSLETGRTTFKSTEKLVDECLAYIRQGFKAIKFGWGNRFETDNLDQIAAIRRAIGPEVHLMLDFGCPAYHTDGWAVSNAIDLLHRLEPFDLFFFEEPLHPYDLEGFAALTKASKTRIASGESLVTQTDFDHFIDRSAVDVIQADAQQIGITTFHRVARHAEASEILLVPHCPWTALAAAAHLQVLSTVRNATMIEYIAMAGFKDVPFLETLHSAMNSRIIDTPPIVEDGYLQLSDRPGLGLGQFVPEVIAELESLQPVVFP